MNSINKTARIAGALYLLLLPLGILGLIYLQAAIIVEGDVATTASNVLASGMLFRFSILASLLIPIVNICVVLTLYKILNPVNKNIALLMVMLILLGAPIAILSEANRLAVLSLLNNTSYLVTFTIEQVQTLAFFLLELHRYGMNVASIFWGLWLLPLGYLVFKSNFLPKIIGILLIIGGLGYLVDFFIVVLLPDIHVTVSQFTFIGELLLPLWLLIKGVNVEQWNKLTTKSDFPT